jgi:hypothetical protein
VPRIVGGIAHEKDELPAQGRRARQAGRGERTADALALKVGIDGKGPQEQRRAGAKPDRPVADGADETAALPCDEAQLAQGADAVPVAVGGLAPPVGAETPVEQGFDQRPVKRAFGSDHEHGGLQEAATGSSQSPVPHRPSACRSGGQDTDEAHAVRPASSSSIGANRPVVIDPHHERCITEAVALSIQGGVSV